MKPLIALDFDGVICDSVDECLITAHNAYHRMSGQADWASSLSDFSEEMIGQFRRLRHLAADASQFWLIYHLLKTGADTPAPALYQAMVAEQRQTLAEFEPRFFQARHELRSADLEAWLAIHSWYPEFQDGWDEVRKRCLVYIVTTKDLASIQHFNRYWQLGVPAEQLWTKEKGTNKAAAIAKIAETNDRTPQDIYFVDDHPQHVEAVSETGARCFWAAWGFLGAYGPPLPEDDRYIRISRLADLLPYLMA